MDSWMLGTTHPLYTYSETSATSRDKRLRRVSCDFQIDFILPSQRPNQTFSPTALV